MKERTIAIRGDIEIVTEHFATFDEALASALQDAPVGCVVEVHDADCDIDDDVDDSCTCTPLELVAGADA